MFCVCQSIVVDVGGGVGESFLETNPQVSQLLGKYCAIQLQNQPKQESFMPKQESNKLSAILRSDTF